VPQVFVVLIVAYDAVMVMIWLLIWFMCPWSSHFIVPELGPDMNFTYASHKAVNEYKEAKAVCTYSYSLYLVNSNLKLAKKSLVKLSCEFEQHWFKKIAYYVSSLYLSFVRKCSGDICCSVWRCFWVAIIHINIFIECLFSLPAWSRYSSSPCWPCNILGALQTCQGCW